MTSVDVFGPVTLTLLYEFQMAKHSFSFYKVTSNSKEFFKDFNIYITFFLGMRMVKELQSRVLTHKERLKFELDEICVNWYKEYYDRAY